MKISDEEVRVALIIFDGFDGSREDNMKDAIAAALKVRKRLKKERKAKAAEYEGERYGACV